MNIQLVAKREGASDAPDVKDHAVTTPAPSGTENGVGIASISAASARDIRVK